MHPPSIDHPLPQTTLEALAGQTITAEGLGGEQALTLFIETLAPACISQDHPRYLSFVPTAPSEVSTLFGLMLVLRQAMTILPIKHRAAKAAQ